MTVRQTGLVYRKLRAPRTHGSRLVDPFISDFQRLWAENRQLIANRPGQLAGKSWPVLLNEAREELWQITGRDGPPSQHDGQPLPVVMTGHQPELFHPGVWFKNFLVDHLARQVGSVGVHVVMDNDVAKQPAVHVPVRRADGQWHTQRLAFDAPRELVAYEEHRPVDRQTFDSFGERVCETIAPLVPNPLLERFWPAVVRDVDRGLSVGDSFVAARSELEREWGVDLQVVQMSRLSATRSFANLVFHLFEQADKFRDVHNQVLAHYRRIHRIRTALQPIPDLRQKGDWIELPCWVWTIDEPDRRHLYVRKSAQSLELSDLGGFNETLTCGEASGQIDQWQSFCERGIKIRPRALLATMYFRLFLCDWFVHGIGGAKYDQITDEIVRKFFGITPPTFQVASSTHHLSIRHAHVSEQDLRVLDKHLRDLKFHPEICAPKSEVASILADEKKFWTAGQWATEHSAARRHREITRINDSFQRLVQPLRTKILSERGRLLADQASCRVLESREYSFCLFPDKQLRNELVVG
mgnify:CR=1 FL=1|jgi:hypothetical protein